ncbi:MAG: type IV secretory system conjugative DNA transfer family protein [Magnetospiraceae bacterium]
MPLHFAARMHAFVNGLFGPDDVAETRALHDKASALFKKHDLASDEGREDFAVALGVEVLETYGLPRDHPQAEPVLRLVFRLLDYEGLFVLPRVDWSDRHSVSQLWEIRDRLNEQRRIVEDLGKTRELLRLAIVACLGPLYDAVPALLETHSDGNGISVPTDLVRNAANLGPVTERIMGVPFDDELERAGLFARHRWRLERNLIAASGGNPEDPKGFTRAAKLPGKSDIRDPMELMETYLGGTPIGDLFGQRMVFTIPTAARFEHHHIVAGSGHGKTQTLQYLISEDLDAVARGERSVVVMDSQGDLIRNISRLADFASGGPLHDRIVIIDPTDVEWPVSLNLFDVGIERLSGYPPLERERLTNSILELYDFVLGSLLAAEMTQKQNVIFRYVTRLMLHIPDATIHTLRDLMEPDSEVKFAEHIAKLQGTARHFFETEFASKEFEQTKKQVLRRLWGILENQTFERMFSHPRSKLDLFAEMNAGKVILINTAKDLLKETGTEIFGRFFIALIAQAAQERATLPERDRMPTIVYIDEAADYFDRNIGIILSQARKYNVGMVLAHQYLGQLEPKLQEAFAANTSIKFAGGVSARDAKALAGMLGCDASLIEDQPKGHFAASVRGFTKGAVPLAFQFGTLEKRPRMGKEDRAALQDAMRAKYAIHYTKLNVGDSPTETEEDEPPAPEKEPPPDRPDGPDVTDTSAKPEW